MRRALRDLFEVLNTPPEKRSKYLKDDLKAFPYTNGGLFEEEIDIPQFTEELRTALLQNASLDFDWSEIAPTIFGAVFESTLNPETRGFPVKSAFTESQCVAELFKLYKEITK